MSGYITFEERLENESMIFQRCSFGENAKKINKDHSTISREIRRHSVIEKTVYSAVQANIMAEQEISISRKGALCDEAEISRINAFVKVAMIKFNCYPKCTTCQKAQKWLDDNQIEYEFRNIKEHNPSFGELSIWYKMSGFPLKKFFNTSGLLYKSMELKDKLPTMTEEEKLKLLATDGMLVKRPLLIGKDFVLVGFKESEWSEKLI